MPIIDLSPIANAVIALLALLVTGFLIPWLRNHIAAQRLDEIQKWVKIAVDAAEQCLTSGVAKKTVVKNFLQAKGFSLDTDELDTMIEAAVHELPSATPHDEPM